MSASAPEPRSPWPTAAAGTAAALNAPVATALPKIWPNLSLLTAFWVYVTLSNILYGVSMQESLATIGVNHVFAPWNARLLQHLMLYPALIACMAISRRVGWQPLWRAVTIQLLCGLAFSALATPAMNLGHILIGHPQVPPSSSSTAPVAHALLSQQQFLWLAGVTSFLLNYAFCLALLTGFEFYRRYRDSQLRSAALERSLSAAHLAALRMQLSPHTLFNLLHTIRGNIAWEPAVAQSMIVQLSDLLRRLLRAGERELSRLQDELDFVRLYLQLQQRRFPDRLSISVADNDTVPAVWVPSLILQPLVENAVLHGLANHQSSVAIRVEVAASGEILTLRVVNSVAAGDTPTVNQQTGIGIRNVRERLAIQFGERATLSASAGRDHDWMAEIRMPLLRDGSS